MPDHVDDGCNPLIIFYQRVMKDALKAGRKTGPRTRRRYPFG